MEITRCLIDNQLVIFTQIRIFRNCYSIVAVSYTHLDLPTDIVSIGSKVLLKDIEFDEDVEYYIVGSTEADPSEGKISDESPVGKALLGHRVGDRVEVEVPSGMIEFEVLEISK